MKLLYLTNTSKKVIVDDNIYDSIKDYKWYVTAQGYAARTEHIGRDESRVNARTKKGKFIYKSKVILLHRFLTNAPSDMQVDHKNRKRLDNRLENLRICTPLLNSLNRGKQSNNTSGHIGVSWHECGRWRAYIDGKHIGLFGTLEEAIQARSDAEKEYRSEL